MDMIHLDSVLPSRAGKPESLIEVLQDIQSIYNHLPEEALWKVFIKHLHWSLAASILLPYVWVLHVMLEEHLNS